MRAGRVLLAERSLTALGLVGRHPTEPDSRLEAVEVLATYDALLTDAVDDVAAQVQGALDAGISCVTWVDGDDLEDRFGDKFEAAGLSLLVGCNLGSGIAPALTAHEVATTENVLDVTMAWTEPGTPRRKGEPIPFPEPVGPRWAESRRSPFADRTYVAHVSGEWAAATVRITGATDGGVVTRIVGVADLAVHLEAIALATGAMVVEDYPPGLHHPVDQADHYLTRALEAGLDVAGHTMRGS